MRSLFPTIVLSSLVATGAGPQGSATQPERLSAMRAIADSVKDVTAGPNPRQKLDRLAEPLYRYDDPARRYSDGTVWAWGRSGRPAALLTLTMQPAPASGFSWVVELTSLAPGPVAATFPVVAVWQPTDAGVVMRNFPGAPLPEENALKLFMQMKELVRHIKAHEVLEPRNKLTRERYELRALPSPVHRYSDEASGLIDGAIFLLSYGVNPELVLLVEARREGSSGPAWSYGFGRIAIAEVHVDFKAKEIWSHPGGSSGGPRDTYWVFTLPRQEK